MSPYHESLFSNLSRRAERERSMQAMLFRCGSFLWRTIDVDRCIPRRDYCCDRALVSGALRINGSMGWRRAEARRNPRATDELDGMTP